MLNPSDCSGFKVIMFRTLETHIRIRMYHIEIWKDLAPASNDTFLERSSSIVSPFFTSFASFKFLLMKIIPKIMTTIAIGIIWIMSTFFMATNNPTKASNTKDMTKYNGLYDLIVLFFICLFFITFCYI
ncbi:hypothetical protein CMI38_01330 [Candidatus Pacearchaeota archaeon]|nr:hypothetical protein [Candidatus Pacearchaeota archaeon]